MAAEIYVKEVEKSPENEEASETIHEGDFVTAEVGGGLHKTDPASDAVVDGIVPHRERGPHLPEHEYDYSEPLYESGDYPTPFYTLEDGMDVMPRTVIDENAPAPSIQRNNVVGIILMDGSSYGSGQPVLVEEGYTADPDGDGTSTTFNRSNDNFLAVGVAKKDVTDYGVQVPAKVRGRILDSR